MSRSRTLVVANARMLLSTEGPSVALMMLLPFVFMAFLVPTTRAALVAGGHQDANGAEQVVPGMTVMFAFFSTGTAASLFFREHAWGTWERLRASPARPVEIMIGKTVPVLVATYLVLATMLFGGGLVFGLPLRGSLPGAIALTAAFGVFLMAMALLLVALCRTLNQVNVVASMVGMVLAGLGGALAPPDSLPGWARHLAPLSPARWAMRGYESLFLERGGLADVLAPVAVLVGAAVVCFVLAAWRFRFGDDKIGEV